MEQLLNKIKEKSTSLSNFEITYAKELSFLNDLCSKYVAIDPDTLLQIDNEDLVLALIHVYNLDNTFEYTEQLTSHIRQIIDTARDEMVEQGVYIFHENQEETDDFFLITQLKDCDGLEKIYEVDEVLQSYANICEYKKIRERMLGDSDIYDDCPSKIKRLVDRDMKATLKEKYQITKIMGAIQARREELLNKYRLESKKNNKAIVAYQELLDMLKQNEKQPIMTLPKRLEEAIDEEIVYEVLLTICRNHEQKYQELKENNDKLMDKNTTTKLDESLFEYGISSKTIPKKYVDFILKDVDLTEMKEFIRHLLEMSFDVNEIMNSNMVYLFKDSTLEQLTQIKRLYNSSIVTKEFLKQNLGVFLSKNSKKSLHSKVEPLFEDIIQNVEIMRRTKVDFTDPVCYQPELLLTSPLEILKNEQLLNYYHKNQQSVEVKNCQLLIDTTSFDFIDFCLEQGIDPSLVKSIPNSSLNKQNIMKRILILKTLGMDFKDNKNCLTNKVLTGSHFYVRAQDLDSFIVNQTPNYLDEKCAEILSKDKRNSIGYLGVSKKLDELYLCDDKLTYNFDGTIISKNKVLRNFTVLKNNLSKQYSLEEMLFQSILYPSVLSEEQIQSIKTCLDSTYKIGTDNNKYSNIVKKKK